jgi:hypothetical protein
MRQTKETQALAYILEYKERLMVRQVGLIPEIEILQMTTIMRHHDESFEHDTSFRRILIVGSDLLASRKDQKRPSQRRGHNKRTPNDTGTFENLQRS